MIQTLDTDTVLVPAVRKTLQTRKNVAELARVWTVAGRFC